MASGQYVHMCIIATHMTQKFQNLKKNIVSDLDAKDRTIEQLKAQLKALGEDVTEHSSEEIMMKLQKGGAE